MRKRLDVLLVERGQELQRRLGQLRRLLDDGTIDDPAVAPLVESLEERIDALEAQLDKTTGDV